MKWFLIAAFLAALVFGYSISPANAAVAGIAWALVLTGIGWIVARKADIRWGAASVAGLMLLGWMGA